MVFKKKTKKNRLSGQVTPRQVRLPRVRLGYPASGQVTPGQVRLPRIRLGYPGSG